MRQKNNRECNERPKCSRGIRDLLHLLRRLDRKHRPGRCMSKKAACRAHSAKRAKERFGITFTRDVHNGVRRQIRLGTALSLFKESCSRHHYAVMVEGKILPIVWDRLRKVIVTVLPPQALEPFAHRVARHWSGYGLG